MSNQQTLGELIDAQLKKKKMQRNELAEKMGVTGGRISQIKKNGAVRLSTLKELAKALDLPWRKVVDAAEYQNGL